MNRCIIYTLYTLSIIFALWGISVYEFGVLGLPFSYIKGWDIFAKALSYSIIGGWIIYILTSWLPKYQEKSVRSPYINLQLLSLNKEYSYIFESLKATDNRIRYFEIILNREPTDIISAASIPYLITQIIWDDNFTDTSSSYREHVISFMKKLMFATEVLITSDSRILGEKQIHCLYMIRQYILEQNWCIKNDEISDTQISNILTSISYPLQYSIGLNPSSHIKCEIKNYANKTAQCN